jgi:organic radical activating enzyme
MLYLVEDFYSIQGEGRFIGTPSIFFRFGGCNLGCAGFGEHFIKGKRVYGCDSIQAVNKELFADSWKKVNKSRLVEILDSHLEHLDFKPHIVITGGEPLIYTTNSDFYAFISYLVENDFIVTIETNSTIVIDFDKYEAYRGVVFAMAVKLSNSGEPYEKRVNKEAIDAIAKNSAFSFFKFTLSKNLIEFRAYDEIVDIVAPYVDKEIFCMPQGSTINELKRSDRAVAEFCMVHGFIYSDRLQVRLWNRERRR